MSHTQNDREAETRREHIQEIKTMHTPTEALIKTVQELCITYRSAKACDFKFEFDDFACEMLEQALAKAGVKV